MNDPVALYMPLLIEDREEALLDLFLERPRISDPLLGEVSEMNYGAFVSSYHAWLLKRGASVDILRLTLTERRRVAELLLSLTLENRRISLPVAVVADMFGDKFLRVRVYHSTWPLTGGHAIRHPVIDEDETLSLPDVVSTYMKALSSGDLEGVLACFEEEASAREPSGGPYLYRGSARLREFYSRLFADPGGIQLRHCTATDDGRACAVEFIAWRWGRTDLPPQAGIAVYERGESGLLRAARIYDDVEPPLPRPGGNSHGN